MLLYPEKQQYNTGRLHTQAGFAGAGKVILPFSYFIVQEV